MDSDELNSILAGECDDALVVRLWLATPRGRELSAALGEKLRAAGIALELRQLLDHPAALSAAIEAARDLMRYREGAR